MNIYPIMRNACCLMLALFWLDTRAADNPLRTQIATYDAETPTEIVTAPGIPTDLELAPQEHVTGLALGDTVQWRVEQLPGHLFIKPLRAGLFTAATLVTNQRVYTMLLRSTTPAGPWRMKVRWIMAQAPRENEVRNLTPKVVNHRYTIDGKTEFRPHDVFDDGRFTWIDMGHPQVLPALFMVGDHGPELINYLLRSPYFVVQRLMPRFLLKLGDQEINVTNHAYGNPSP